MLREAKLLGLDAKTLCGLVIKELEETMEDSK